MQPTAAHRTAAATIAARLRALAPADAASDRLRDALFDMDAIAAGTDGMDADGAAWAIESAAETTADWTTDGWADEAALAACDALPTGG